MDKIEVISALKKEQVISVVRIDAQDPVTIIKAIVEGGVKFIEVTLTMNKAFDIISELSDSYENTDVVIGAGTVLDSISCRLAIDKGAKFIVAPSFNEEVAKLCNLYRIAYIPGVYTPNDITKALSYGVDILKLFPASTIPPFVIKEFKGPFPQANFIISGKVDSSNAQEWLNNEALAICVGSVLTKGFENGAERVLTQTQTFLNVLGK